MTLDIELQSARIEIMPQTEAAEIIQNVRTILLTQKFSVPLDREFGQQNCL